MREQIKQILMDCGLDENDAESTDLIKNEMFDSLTIAEIIIEIEDMFGIEIDGNDIIPENFQNIDKIVLLVKKNGGQD